MTDPESTEMLDPGMVRAGAAAAARRRELDISQRSLATDGIINAGALIAFEKGRSWPRERTRAKLEEVLRWPPGTIARLRQGESVTVERRVESPATDRRRHSADRPGGSHCGEHIRHRGRGVAVRGGPGFHAACDEDPGGSASTRGGRGQSGPNQQGVAGIDQSAERRAHPLSTNCMLRAARAPGATLGQRLYAARRGANLTIARNCPSRRGFRRGRDRAPRQRNPYPRRPRGKSNH